MPQEQLEACIQLRTLDRRRQPPFSDRRTPRTEDGATLLPLCGDCNERAISHYRRQPNERDMAQIAARGPMAGMG